MVQQLILAAIALSYFYRTRRGAMYPCIRDQNERTGPLHCLNPQGEKSKHKNTLICTHTKLNRKSLPLKQEKLPEISHSTPEIDP